MPTIHDWHGLRVRTGRIVRARPNKGARDPAYCLWIDFGELGVLQASAKITEQYRSNDLPGRTVVAVTGFDSMRIGGFRSDVLVLGAETPDGVVLLRPDDEVAPGTVIA